MSEFRPIGDLVSDVVARIGNRRPVPESRKPFIKDGVCVLPLTRGREAILDAEDMKIVEGRRWYALGPERRIYAAFWLRGAEGKPMTIYLHRVILSAPPGMEVDHIDDNSLNNRRSNLRLVSHAQNAMNRGPSALNTSGFKGVRLHRASNRWQARIKVDNREHYLGSFDTPEEAHKAYVAASAQLHGEFGRVK